jgi:hypothetical protein
MWPSVVFHEHWPVSQRMIVEIGDYAWSEHIVTVFLACQITIVQPFIQQEAVQTIPWPAMSPDMNPIEHVWDFIGRKFIQRNPKCQNIDELRSAILQFPQKRLRRLVRSMTRRVIELHTTRGGYTRNLRSIYHPERRGYDVGKMGFKQALEKRKTSVSLMEVFNIALKCRVFRF